MARRVTNGAGTDFNTAANWDEGVNTPSIHASTNIAVTGGGVFSAVFTAPNLVNKATGVVVPVAARGTAGNITATLQHDVGAGFVDVAGAAATIAITSLVASTHVFFKFTTPFTWDTTAAGKFRVKLNTSGAAGTTSIAADSGGANFAYDVYQDNNVVPTTGDDISCISPNQGASHIMVLDTSPSIGSGTNTSVPTFRSWGNAIVCANNGGIGWPTGTSRTITCKGNVHVQSGGWYQMGQASAQIAAGTTARLVFDQNGTTTNYGFVKDTGGKVTIQSVVPTYRMSTIVSGVGTTLSPLVTADATGWSVGDELVFAPGSDSATNYSESETRFIKTIAGTSITLSTTVGGAEAALTYTKAAGTPVFHVTRGCLVDTTDTTKAWYGNFVESTTVANLDIDGVRFETTGGATTSKTNINFATINNRLGTIDDLVVYRALGTASSVELRNDRNAQSYSWWILYNSAAFGNTGGYFVSATNKTWSDCHAIAVQGAGFANGGANNTFNRCGNWGSGLNSATAISGFYVINAVNILFNDCDSHAARSYGIELSTCSDIRFIDCRFGTIATNKVNDIDVVSDGSNTVLFDNCLFDSATLISGYTGMNDGSEIAFNKFNQTANDHRWYTPYGIARSCGAGLADTNVRTSGSLAVRIAPENSTHGFVWDFKVVAKALSYSNILGFIQKNATFGTDDVVVDFYLPGLTPGVDTPSATYTMPDDTTWNVFNLAASYTGTVPLYSTVRITAKSATAGAYCYVDDLYNGTNNITALDVWDKGKPSPIMFEQLGDAAAVWAVATSTFTTTGTAGYLLTKLLTVAKFLGQK